MNPHFFTAPFYFAFIWFRVQGSRFRGSPRGVLPLDRLQKRGERVLQVQRAWREWYGAFRHPERRKTSCVKETLIQSQNQIMKLHK